MKWPATTSGLRAGNASSIAARASRICRCSMRCIGSPIKPTAQKWSTRLSKYAPTWLVQMPGLIDDGGVQRSAKAGRRRQPAADAARDGRCARATEQPATAGAGIRGSALERSFDDHVARSARAADRARAAADSRHASTGRYSARGASASNLVHELAGRYCENLSPPPLTAAEVSEYLRQSNPAARCQRRRCR